MRERSKGEGYLDSECENEREREMWVVMRGCVCWHFIINKDVHFWAIRLFSATFVEVALSYPSNTTGK